MNTKTPLLFLPFILLVIIIILVAALFFGGVNQKPESVDNSSGLIISNNAIYVSDQIPGYSVSVQVVHLEKPGFVVIHEDADGTPGKILGVSALLAAGETKNLSSITLSRAIKDNETIYAMLHFDNGDGKFDAANDKPVIDPVGNAPVMMIVTVDKEATEPGVVNP